MNKDCIGGNGKALRGKASDHWGNFTNDRLEVIAGKRDQLECEIRQAHQIVKDAVERQKAG